MHLTTFWFLLIAVLWVGYFFLEGFDFGVGMLLPFLGRDDPERRDHDQHHRPGLGRQRGLAALRRRRDLRRLPGLVRDAVQRLLPGAAAHPGRADPARRLLRVPQQGATDPRWRRGWDRAHLRRVALLPALLWGVAFANIVHGVPINAAHVYTGNLLTLLNPYALLGGLVTLTLFMLHGALFLALKTTGDLRAARPAHGSSAPRWPPSRWPRPS